ncbi:Fur family transcriptional regulator [Hydrogenophaga sp.]|uniref:Fur family transcriptional regulator n=1 Tax=Hydrogenophaga sp. TaxID=1904254 RepID=UPI0027171197|nr:Fur family transcriptional regulator [Hydrogenophaga sp.]MDO9437119.1 Fur family transcriptional regulator [Hydrogenophaga sp.]
MSTRPTKEPVAVPPHIQTRLEAAGLRRTLATRAVLGLFLAQPQGGLTHAQVQNALTTRGLDVNRVTLYRLLDRLATCGVLQRRADDQARTWHFSLAPLNAAARGADQGALPQFECDACHQQFALPGASDSLRALTRDLQRAMDRLGHRTQGVEVAVHGTCASCVETAA